MKILIGLGNAGPKYHLNRHNVGILFANHLQSHSNHKVFISDTYMNLSGKFVKKILNKQALTLSSPHVFIACDHLDKPVGKW